MQTAQMTAIESNLAPAAPNRNMTPGERIKRKNEMDDITAWLEEQEDAELNLLRYEMSHRGHRSYAGGTDRFDRDH